MSAPRRDPLPTSPLIRFLRWWLPAIVVAVGVGLAAVNGFSEDALDGGAGIVGAGLSIWLLNLLLRVGISGDRERDDEAAARDYFDEHGRWPDEG